METKFDKEINELWKSNSKIPFMQSKEILALGYISAANKYSTVTPKIEETKKEEQKNLEYKNSYLNTINKNELEQSKKKEKNKEKKKADPSYFEHDKWYHDKEIELRTLQNILSIIKSKGHLLEVYNYVDNKVQNLKNEIGVSY